MIAQVLSTWAPNAHVEVKLLTVGTPGSQDLEQAADAARRLGMRWEAHPVSPHDIEVAAERVRKVEGGTTDRPSAAPLSGVPLEVQTGIYLALERCTTPRVLCGQGADELFLGYAHFLPLEGERLRARYLEDLRRLREEDWPASQRVAASLGRDLRAPFLDPEWSRQVEEVPLEERRIGGVAKGLLREVARRAGLPEEVAGRRKKAFQYGSGVHAVLAPR